MGGWVGPKACLDTAVVKKKLPAPKKKEKVGYKEQ
jgi:hypothetical protein